VFTFSGYPFDPKQFMLLEMFVIGLASFMLALEPNDKRIEGHFLRSVIVKSVPYALVMFVPVLILMLLNRFGIIGMSEEVRNSTAMLVTTLVGLINLLALCRPYTKWRAGVCTLVSAGIAIVGIASIYLNSILPIIPYDMIHILPAFSNLPLFFGILGISISFSILLHTFLPGIEKKIDEFASRLEEKKKKTAK
jgi:cation-transporting ATPase E